jgi:hypothetical protein
MIGYGILPTLLIIVFGSPPMKAKEPALGSFPAIAAFETH